MMKALTTALGALTILAVTGMATPSGQAMLGLRQTQTQTPVSVIADPGQVNPTAADVATPVHTAAAVAAASAPVVAPHAAAPAPATTPVAQPAITHAAPAARPAASPSAPAPAASPVNAGAIANILLNLPQVLQPNQGRSEEAGPAPANNDQWVPPGHRKAKDHKVKWPDEDPADEGH